MARIAKGSLYFSICLHSLSVWVASPSSQHQGLKIIRFCYIAAGFSLCDQSKKHKKKLKSLFLPRFAELISLHSIGPKPVTGPTQIQGEGMTQECKCWEAWFAGGPIFGDQDFSSELQLFAACTVHCRDGDSRPDWTRKNNATENKYTGNPFQNNCLFLLEKSGEVALSCLKIISVRGIPKMSGKTKSH